MQHVISFVLVYISIGAFCFIIARYVEQRFNLLNDVKCVFQKLNLRMTVVVYTHFKISRFQKEWNGHLIC